MSEREILRDLFDDKIVNVINLFIEQPEKQFYLTEVANASKVNVTTTFRILNKLILKNFIRAKVIGKVRLYQLDLNEKTRALSKVLKKDGSPLQEFINKIIIHPRIKGIILESSTKTNAKLLIIGDFLPREKIKRAIEKIKNKNNFRIDFVEINENQFKDLKNLGLYDLDKKMIWKRQEQKN